MTMHYYTNDTIINPNWNLPCAGCGDYIQRGQKSERIAIQRGRARIIEVRHLRCRPDWMPKVKRRQPRDARGRFASIYDGPAVGERIRYDQLDELPVGSRVTGTGNGITYQIAPGQMLTGITTESESTYHRTYPFRDVGGHFRVQRVGDGPDTPVRERMWV
jgi:hypothetical protein